MYITEAIKQLEIIKKNHGDIPVEYCFLGICHEVEVIEMHECLDLKCKAPLKFEKRATMGPQHSSRKKVRPFILGAK